MWQFLTAALSAIPSAATSAYAFGAYALAILAYVITAWRVVRNRNLLASIHKLPPKDRLSAFEIEVGGVRLAEGISPEQWVQSRIHKFRLLAYFATCAVVVVIGTVAMLNGGTHVRIYHIVNKEYQLMTNGASLSNADIQHIRELIEAAKAGNLQQASTAFNDLSEAARMAYKRAYPSAKDNLISPDEIISVTPESSNQASLVSHEVEPNDDIHHANPVPLYTAITAAIANPSDVDYFTFILPGARRDYIDVVINNDSTTLSPQIDLFDANKNGLSSNYANTSGADVTLAFVAEPNSRYYVKISSLF